MKKQYRALIVDDERLARRDLISLLEEHPQLTVIGEADDVPSAAEAVKRHDPDIIFLDIQMPGDSGFDLLEKIDTEARIIFITAFDEYAIRAFEVNALDYLLKPVNPERLTKALTRLEGGEPVSPVSKRRMEYDDRMFLMLGKHFRFLKVSSIQSITAAGDYSEVRTLEDKGGLTLKSIKEWETRLPPQYFLRIHRSTIVNMEYIERVEEWFNYSFRVYLKDQEEPFVISRRYASKLKERLG